MQRRSTLLLALALALAVQGTVARPGPTLDEAGDGLLTGSRGGATAAGDAAGSSVDQTSDDDAWWTTSRGTQANANSGVAAQGGAAQADSEGSLFLQQQLNALDAAALDQQPVGGNVGVASQAQLSQDGAQPQAQQASLGGLASGSGGTGTSDYVQPSGSGTRAASTVQPLQATPGQQLHTPSTQQQQLDAEGDGDADAAQDDYDTGSAASGGAKEGEEEEEQEDGGGQAATKGGSVYESDFLDGDDDSGAGTGHEGDSDGDSFAGSDSGSGEEEHSVVGAGGGSGAAAEQRQLIQDWDGGAAGSSDGDSELGTEVGELHDGLADGGDGEGDSEDDDDMEYGGSSGSGGGSSLRQEGVGDDEWDEEEQQPAERAGVQATATTSFGAAQNDAQFTHGLPGN